VPQIHEFQILAAALITLACPLSAQTVHYRTYVAETDSTLWRSAIGVPDRDAAISEVVWRSESGDSHRELFRVDRDGSTRSWAISFPEEGTDYVGQRLGDSVSIQGVISGKEIQALFEIDSDPVFANIAMGLAAFVQSGDLAVDFWTFSPEDASMIHMDAKREHVDTLHVAGAATAAVRVRWAPKGWRGLFYSRRFWFRVADGILLETDARDGRVTVLTGIS